MSSSPLDPTGPTVMPSTGASSVRGRDAECEALSHLARDVCAGNGRALVVRGEAGMGKTSLLGNLLGSVSGFRIARATGVESETELPFAGLHQLCAPLADNLARLPVRQQTALRVAFGLESGPEPDRFLIGLSVLNLLAESTADQPVICLVDDAQWLDRASAQTLAFVARRLVAERVMIIVALRDPTERLEWAGLDELTLHALSSSDARALLDSVLRRPVDDRVRQRIVAETRGNPSALLELPLTWTVAELADGLDQPTPAPLMGRTEARFLHRLASLPSETRQLLLIAAAEPLGDMALLWRVAADLGIDPDSGTAAEGAGLIELSGHLRFTHPLVRSAVYRSASLSQRQRVHCALADATDAASEPDRRAWHRALSIVGPSEEIADELERSAARAQTRGRLASAAVFLQRAHTVTPEAEPRARRGLAAASLHLEAGSLRSSQALLDAVQTGPLSTIRSVEIECLRGKIAFAQGRSDEASRRLRRAAQQLEPLDPRGARELHLESLTAAMWMGGPQSPVLLSEAATAAAAAPAAPEPPRTNDLLVDGLVERQTKGYAAAAPILGRALAMASEDVKGTVDVGRGSPSEARVGSIVALELWDYEASRALAVRQVQMARTSGSLVQLRFALNYFAGIELLGGRLGEAAALTAEDRVMAGTTGESDIAYGDVLLAAFGGKEPGAGPTRSAQTMPDGQSCGHVGVLADYASAVLHNGLGRHEVAEETAWRLFDRGLVGYGTLAVSELAEAASRTGQLAHLEAALAWLSERVRVTPTDWAVGVEARTRALLSTGGECDRLFLVALKRLSQTRLRPELARTHLLYGEWLRREGRRVDARGQLRTSHDMLAEMGMEGFARRARCQLLATAETARKRTVEAQIELTAQEGQIALLARDGQTNPQIAIQLFISPRTVEWHLRKVFAKLDITSRKQLGDALPRGGIGEAVA